MFDNYEPQGFADRGGLLGRLLSLRPDLAPDEQNGDQPAPNSEVSQPAWLRSANSANTPGFAVGSSRSGNIHLAQNTQAPPIRLMSPDPLFVQPQLDPFPPYQPFMPLTHHGLESFLWAGRCWGLG